MVISNSLSVTIMVTHHVCMYVMYHCVFCSVGINRGSECQGKVHGHYTVSLWLVLAPPFCYWAESGAETGREPVSVMSSLSLPGTNRYCIATWYTWQDWPTLEWTYITYYRWALHVYMHVYVMHACIIVMFARLGVQPLRFVCVVSNFIYISM